MFDVDNRINIGIKMIKGKRNKIKKEENKKKD